MDDQNNQQPVQQPVTGGTMPTVPLGGDGQPVQQPVVPVMPMKPEVPGTEQTPTELGSLGVDASQVADQVMDQKADFGQPMPANPTEDTTPQVPTEPAPAE